MELMVMIKIEKNQMDYSEKLKMMMKEKNYMMKMVIDQMEHIKEKSNI